MKNVHVGFALAILLVSATSAGAQSEREPSPVERAAIGNRIEVARSALRALPSKDLSAAQQASVVSLIK